MAYKSELDRMLERKAALSFSVLFAILRDCTGSGIRIDCLKSGPEPLLSIVEERHLVIHIKAMADFGYGYTHEGTR